MQKFTVTLFRYNRNEWRWRMKASNGRILGAASEGYKNRAAAIKNIRTVTGLDVKLYKGVRGDNFTWHRVARNHV